MDKPKSVEEYIANEPQWQEELIILQSIVLDMGLDEQIKWLFPCYTYNKKNVVGLAAFKGYFGLWFYQGALLQDTHGKLSNAQEGKTQAMRQWRMHEKSEIDEDLIKAYIAEAIENEIAGKRVKITAKALIEAPELVEALSENHMLASAFESLSQGRRKDYHNYINSAKRTETKKSRIAKCIPLILQGVGLADKYRK